MEYQRGIKKKKLPHGKIEDLKKLIREKKFLERQELLDRQVITESLRVEKIEKQEIEPQANKKPEHEPAQPPGPERPPSLSGFSIGEILLMEADGWLSKEEEEWLRKKTGRLERRYIPPEKNRWMH